MANYIRPRGTLDIYDLDSKIYDYIEKIGVEVARRHNFTRIITPTFEQTNLYIRSTGESSDIVKKEMYDFLDKGGRSVTLRPEGTAGVIRAVVENKLYVNDLPLKYYYIGSFFRYDRPGLGRYREFQQYGVELIGSNSYLDDVEIIFYVVDMLKALGLNNYTIKINTFGDVNCRQKYRDVIKEFFANCLDDLCEDCKSRFITNPLRILDCKIDHDYFKTKNIPTAISCLDEKNKEIFDNILKLLDENQIKYEIDNYLVRGLDYYTGLIFEIEIQDENNQVYTVGAGGRYNNLVKDLGGPDLECVGYAWGINRLSIILKEKFEKDKFIERIDTLIIPLDTNAFAIATKINNNLRDNGFISIINYKKNASAMFKYADKKNVKYAIVIGEEELKTNTVQVKNLDTQIQEKIELVNLLSYLRGKK